LMVGDKDRPGYDIVRDTWKPILGAEFDRKWNRVLHDGLLAGSELTEVVPDVKGEAFAGLGRATESANGLEIVFVPSPANASPLTSGTTSVSSLPARSPS